MTKKTSLCFASRYWRTGALLLLIIYLSLFRISTPKELPTIPHLDKMVHFCMYATLAATLQWERMRCRPSHRASGWVSFLIAALFGASMEFAQITLTSYRSGDWLDFIANSVGALVGGLLVARIFRK